MSSSPCALRAPPRFEALGPLSLRDLLSEHRELRTSMLRNRANAPAVDALFREYPPGQTHSEFGEAFPACC